MDHLVSVEDRAIEKAAVDTLDRGPFVQNLIRALIDDEYDTDGKLVGRRATSVVVGLTGRWGLGKSSVLNLVSEQLQEMKHVAVATLNPWLFKGREELLTAFFNQLREAMGKDASEKARDIVGALNSYQWAISGTVSAAGLVADMKGAAGWGTKFSAWLIGIIQKGMKVPDRSPQQERKSLEKKLAERKTAVVVLIDELDRVEDEDVRAVAQLVKAVGDIKGISYLVAYDPERVADALGRGRQDERRKTGEAYLEKIVQHPVPLRPLFVEDTDAMLKSLLQQHETKLPTEPDASEKEILDHLRLAIKTPRELKRLVGAYAIIERMVRGEIFPLDVLAYCWLLTKSPGLQSVIAERLDAVVDDPGEAELVDRVSRELDRTPTDLTAKLGPLAQEHEPLLRILFPSLTKAGTDHAGDRISKRRNLVRLIYLGNPPGITTRDEVEEVWNAKDVETISRRLEALRESGHLAGFIDRLDDLLPYLPTTSDRNFWLALAKTLERPHDWVVGPERLGALSDDASSYLMRLGLRNSSAVARVKDILQTLELHSDLTLLPGILRKHVFRYGLGEDSQARPGDALLSEDETRDLLRRQLPTYKAAVIEGRVLKRVTNPEALFVIKNTGSWDDELRASLTEQLRMPEARATLAALIVPPGYSADRTTFETMFDADAVLQWMAEAGEGEVQSPIWLEQCVTRLRRILEGKHPSHDF